jgi:hypothetical protein
LQSEVAQIAEGHPVAETTHFGFGATHHFRYALVPKYNIGHISALFENGHIEVVIPIEQGKMWAQSEQVSMESTAKIAEGDFLEILIEKDFQCLHQTDATDQSDNFPNQAN